MLFLVNKPDIQLLTMAERGDSPVLLSLWSYVEVVVSFHHILTKKNHGLGTGLASHKVREFKSKNCFKEPSKTNYCENISQTPTAYSRTMDPSLKLYIAYQNSGGNCHI